MPLRQDVWTHDSCLLCQSMHSTEEDKNKHELDASHKKKVVVYDFLSRELSCLTPSNQKSFLYERYYRANTCIAGLDCICELNFSWSAVPLWACTICYVAGETLESADDHMHSSYHKRNYICEYHPDRYAELLKVQEKSARNKQSLLEQEAIIDTLMDAKGLLSPDVYVLNERSQEWAFQKLGLTSEPRKASYIAEEVSDNHKIALCYVCGQTFISFSKEEEFREAWFSHLSTNIHQRCKAMQILIHEESLVECEGVPAECELRTNCEFRRIDDSSDGEAKYGPTVGLEHLIIFNGTDCFCSLCFAILPSASVTNHFSSEYHNERFFSRVDPGKFLNTQYYSASDRHGILEYCYGEFKFSSHKYFRSTSQIPLLLQKYALQQKDALVKYTLEEVDFGHNLKAVWCEECNEYVNTFGDENAWSIHIFDDSHFERAAKRALCHYEKTVVTRSCAVLDDFARSYPLCWHEQFSVSLGVLSIQSHCEFGLEFIIRDALSAKLYCTCCFVQCEDNDAEMFSKHARSFDHITRAMHTMNKKTMVTLSWRFPNTNDRKPLVMDYLVNYRRNLRQQKHGVSEYNPALFYKMNCSLALPKRLFELAKTAPNDRNNFITANKEQGMPEMIPLNVALNELCRIEVKLEKKEVIVCHCEDCSQSFSENFDKIDNAIAEHLLSLSHWERAKNFDENPFDESQRIHDRESKIKVPPYKQPDPKKKVTWKWNDKKACYEFVYAQLGLEDIRERRHFEGGKSDFFCTLCVQSFKATKLDLECHIRSFSHLFYFMHKHRPAIIPELQAQITAEFEVAEKHKNIRRLFARTLKGCETDKKQSGIPIYDFEERECEYVDVKKALEEDRETAENSAKKSKREPPATYEMFELNVIYKRTNSPKWSNGEELDKHLTMIIEMSTGKNSTNPMGRIVRELEQAKKQLLDTVHFDGMVQLEDNASAASANASAANISSVVEKGQTTEQTKTPTDNEKSKETNAPSRSTMSEAPIATDKQTNTEADAPKGTSKPRDSERWRRTRTPSPHRRSRRHSRSPTQQRRWSRHRLPDHRRSKDSKSPSPKRKRKERRSNDLSERPSSSRSKSVNRRPVSRSSRSPDSSYQSAKKRLDDLKMKLTANETPRQFFPLPPTRKQLDLQSGNIPPPPGPVPPVPGHTKKDVGGAYEAGFFKESYPDLLRKSPTTASNGARSVGTESAVAPTNSIGEAMISSESDKNAETMRQIGTPGEIRNLLMNRLKKDSNKKELKKSLLNIPKDLPAFKQQALIRQHTEKLKANSASKKVDKKGPNTVVLQEKQREDQQEEERLQAISPDPDDIIEVQPQQQEQQAGGNDQPQQQQTEQRPPHNKTVNDLSKSKWDWVNGKFVPSDSTVASQSANTHTSSNVPATSIPPPQGMSIPKIGVIATPKLVERNAQQAQDVLAQLGVSTSVQRIFSGQQSPANVVHAPIPRPTMAMFRPNMPTVTATNLLGQQPLQSSAPFGTVPSVPSNVLATLNSALGVPMAIPPARFNQPTLSPMVGGFAPSLPPQQPAVVNPVEMVLYSKMQLYSRDLASIDNIAALIEYMWKQGYEPIPPGDPSLLFNEILAKRKGLIGANTLYQIICFGHPELETYYCGMCNHWTTVSEMFNHLRASMHRLSYMFRNYKMYHRKAMEELDEERRDLMLERFASKIWDIEGCGRCTNRMRCILNEEAIRRIWPDYLTCVDNSWKIIDDDDEDIALSQRIPQKDSYQPPLAQQKTPTPGAEIAADQNVFSDHSVVRAASAQVRASIVAKKLELAERAGHPGIGLVSINSDKRTDETDKNNATNSKEKKGFERGKESNGGRSERQRDKSKERSKQSSTGKQKRKSRSRERNGKREERDRERERDGRRRSRSKDKGERKRGDREKDRGRQEDGENWVEKAAQFLHKIGDTENATKLYWEAAAKEANVEPSGINHSKTDKIGSIVGSKPTTPSSSLAERLASSGQSMIRRRGQIDEQEKQQVRRQLSPEPPPVTMTTETERQRQQKRLAVDDKSEMRRAIAVMVELQQEYENNGGFLSAEMFFSTCQEFNIAPDEVLSNRLLCETANELRVDLHAGLRAFMQRNQPQQQSTSQAHSGCQFNLQSMGVDPSKLCRLDPRALQSILSKAGATKSPFASASTAAASAPSPMRSRFELHDIALDESMAPGNYVYPSYEEEIGRQQQQQQLHGPIDVDSNIKRLTYAFRPGSQDGPSARSSADIASPVSGGGGVPNRQQQQQRHPCTVEGQPKSFGDPRPAGWGVPPDPKGAGSIGPRSVAASGNVPESEHPMEFDFTNDMGANWSCFSRNQPHSAAASSKSTPQWTDAPQSSRHHFSPGSHCLPQTQPTQRQTPPNPNQKRNSYEPQTLRQQQQVMNPDLRRIAEEVGDDWNSLESFSFEMLGFGASGGRQMEAQRRQSSASGASATFGHPPPPPS